MISKEFLSVVEALAQAFPTWKPSPETIELFAFALSDIPLDRLRVASLTHMRQSKWPPTVAELRELAQPPSEMESAEEAWADVRAQVRSVGSYGIPNLKSPAAYRALDAVGGWKALCGTRTDQMGIAAAHFMRCYAAVAKKHRHLDELTAAAEMLGIGPGERVAEKDGAQRLADFLKPARLNEGSATP